MSPPTTTILIGNPGVGKSTILNCLLGKVGEFRSGISFGGGLTRVLHMHEAPDGNTFIDTPGLSDAKMRKEAAIEIEKALKTGGTFKIFFVITLEAGRVRPDDKTTIQLVLTSAPQITTNYSIIINKLPPATVKKLQASEEGRVELVATINEGLAGTTSIYYYVKVSELEDADNEIVELAPDFLNFISFAPTITITQESVKAIQFDKFDQVKELLSTQLDAMKKDHELMKKKMEEQEERFRKERKEHEEEKREQERRFQIDQARYKEAQDRLLEAQEKRYIEDKIRNKEEQERLLNFQKDAENRAREDQQRMLEAQERRYREEQARHKEEQELAKLTQTMLVAEHKVELERNQRELARNRERFEHAQNAFVKGQNDLIEAQNRSQANVQESIRVLEKEKDAAEKQLKELQIEREATEMRVQCLVQ